MTHAFLLKKMMTAMFMLMLDNVLCSISALGDNKAFISDEEVKNKRRIVSYDEGVNKESRRK